MADNKRLIANSPLGEQEIDHSGPPVGVVRMDVTGNAYDPQIEIKTLPVIKDSLKILGKKPTE